MRAAQELMTGCDLQGQKRKKGRARMKTTVKTVMPRASNHFDANTNHLSLFVSVFKVTSSSPKVLNIFCDTLQLNSLSALRCCANYLGFRKRNRLGVVMTRRGAKPDFVHQTSRQIRQRKQNP
jgi:hypothetical protein